MFELKEIKKDQSGRRVDFDYVCSKDISKYFAKNKFYCEYNIDINTVPDEVLSIPLLGNLLPISWFAGFDIKVEKLDKIFYEQALKLKQQFSEYYPIINSKNSNLIVDALIDGDCVVSGKTAMLFSGGVDAYTTLLRHFEDTPDLITIKGADIATDDDEQWNMVVEYNKSTPAIHNNSKFFIESNLRDFYTFEVDRLLPSLGWWGYVQFGFGLTGLTAPLAYLNSYKTVHIASTASEKMPFVVRGSLPEFDNLVKWRNTEVHHDGYELSRFDKVNSILELSGKYDLTIPLRVCYHDIKENLNCSECEKCCRTIIAIMLNNKNPDLYGFKVDNDIYKSIEKHMRAGFSVATVRYYWNEMFEKFNEDSFYYLDNKKQEQEIMNHLIILNDEAQKKVYFNKSESKIYILKQKIIRNYPKLFKQYLKIRRKLS